MSRAPSEKTELTNARRQLREMAKDLASARSSLNNYRARATQSEQAVAEWKQRFDKLLEFRQLLKVE